MKMKRGYITLRLTVVAIKQTGLDMETFLVAVSWIVVTHQHKGETGNLLCLQDGKQCVTLGGESDLMHVQGGGDKRWQRRDRGSLPGRNYRAVTVRSEIQKCI